MTSPYSIKTTKEVVGAISNRPCIEEISKKGMIINMDNIDKELLEEITGEKNAEFKGAYNIRKNGKGIERKVTENINIITKKDVSGIDIYVKPNTKFEFVHIPVIITESGLTDVVYNDFYIGENATVTIIAGCGIHNDHHKDSQHDGIHRFFLEKRSKS